MLDESMSRGLLCQFVDTVHSYNSFVFDIMYRSLPFKGIATVYSRFFTSSNMLGTKHVI